MKILGVSFDYHDSAAALMVDGKVVAAAQEERFSRIKHDALYPSNAVQFCLESGKITAQDLDAVVHYEEPSLKFSRILQTTCSAPRIFENIFLGWINKRKFEVPQRLMEELGISRDKIHFINHHQSHAAAAYFASPFQHATVITLDGAGEFETITISVGKNTKLEKVHSVNLPNSVGLFYSAFTAFLGFEVNEGEYKVMGMSAFGKPTFYEDVKNLINFTLEGDLELTKGYFDFFTSNQVPYTGKVEEKFGKRRPYESGFDIGDINKEPANDLQRESRHYANIAASLQKVTEEIILSIVEFAIQKTGVPNLCLAGGVALNSVANGKVLKLVKGNLYIHPAAGDSGSALGAALYHHYANASKKGEALSNAYLGKDYADEEILEALQKEKIKFYRYFEKEEELLDFVAEKLNDANVIGWAQGRFEWGPRALGARSIIANPTRSDMQLIVNQKIKFREPFRPFAPSVLEEKACEYFEMEAPQFLESPEYFMLSVVDVKKDKRNKIPAVTHVDGTARIQLVTQKTNKRYYKLIKKFEMLSGVPMVLNTSFNLKGEPMVASPIDALKTFSWCDMDYLVFNNFVIGKESF